MVPAMWRVSIASRPSQTRKNKYVLRQAPKGAKIKFLPQGGKPVIMGGVKYYKCKGVFYKKNKTDDLYEVARP